MASQNYIRQVPATAQDSDALLYGHGYSVAEQMELILDWQYSMPPDEWLKLLGDKWSFMIITPYIDELMAGGSLLGDAIGTGAVYLMMSDEEIAFYESLPDTVTIYRGCYEENSNGMSWSLDKNIAESFINTKLYKNEGQPILVTAEVKKNNILAVKLGRDEAEIITHEPNVISISNIVRTGV